MSDNQQLITIISLQLDQLIHNISGELESMKAAGISTKDHTTSLHIHTISRAVELDLIEMEQLLELINDSVNGGGGKDR